jgi:hypothetical protein
LERGELSLRMPKKKIDRHAAIHELPLVKLEKIE